MSKKGHTIDHFFRPLTARPSPPPPAPSPPAASLLPHSARSSRPSPPPPPVPSPSAFSSPPPSHSRRVRRRLSPEENDEKEPRVPSPPSRSSSSRASLIIQRFLEGKSIDVDEEINEESKQAQAEELVQGDEEWEDERITRRSARNRKAPRPPSPSPSPSSSSARRTRSKASVPSPPSVPLDAEEPLNNDVMQVNGVHHDVTNVLPEHRSPSPSLPPPLPPICCSALPSDLFSLYSSRRVFSSTCSSPFSTPFLYPSSSLSLPFASSLSPSSLIFARLSSLLPSRPLPLSVEEHYLAGASSCNWEAWNIAISPDRQVIGMGGRKGIVKLFVRFDEDGERGKGNERAAATREGSRSVRGRGKAEEEHLLSDLTSLNDLDDLPSSLFPSPPALSFGAHHRWVSSVKFVSPAVTSPSSFSPSSSSSSSFSPSSSSTLFLTSADDGAIHLFSVQQALQARVDLQWADVDDPFPLSPLSSAFPSSLHSAGIYSLDYSAPFILSGGKDSRVLLSRLAEDGAIEPDVEGTGARHTQTVKAVAFCPGSSLFASGSNDRSLCFFDRRLPPPSRCFLHVPGAHTQAVNSVVWKEEGWGVVTGSFDKSCALFDLRRVAFEKKGRGEEEAEQKVRREIEEKELCIIGEEEEEEEYVEEKPPVLQSLSHICSTSGDRSFHPSAVPVFRIKGHYPSSSSSPPILHPLFFRYGTGILCPTPSSLFLFSSHNGEMKGKFPAGVVSSQLCRFEEEGKEKLLLYHQRRMVTLADANDRGIE